MLISIALNKPNIFTPLAVEPCVHVLSEADTYRHAHNDWVNVSERGGKDRVFQGLAGLLRGISRGRGVAQGKSQGATLPA